MDRLETYIKSYSAICFRNIYIPVWIDQKRRRHPISFCLIFYLHSSMDRLETLQRIFKRVSNSLFTFQYGQIRNLNSSKILLLLKKIYIPVWIDQKLYKLLKVQLILLNLHSSMDRLETKQIKKVDKPAKIIYIPVWIDQKRYLLNPHQKP